MQLELTLPAREKRSRACTSWATMRDLPVGMSDTGLPVSPHLAENLSAVFAATQIISETVATLPATVYQKIGDGVREARPSHPVAKVLAYPNDNQTCPEFFETMTAHCLLRGNAYAKIVRNGAGQPVELIPLHPDMVAVLVIPGTRRVVYDVNDWQGGRTRRLLPDEILHLKDRSDDGLVGKSRLARARETFGTSLAVEQFAARTYRNSAALSGVLQSDNQLTESAINHLKNQIRDSYTGTGNAGRVMVLEEGLKFEAISVSPRDAEMLASRQFGIQQISRMFRLPPPLLGDLSGGNFSSLVELGRWFAQQTVVPWLTRWERCLERSLFSNSARSSYEIEFDTDQLLRGDMLTRYQAYRIMRETGVASANEIRRMEHFNPRADAAGDEYLSPLNMSPEQAGTPKPA